MYTLNGDIEYAEDDGYLVLYTQFGDVMIPKEDLEQLAEFIEGMLKDGE